MSFFAGMLLGVILTLAFACVLGYFAQRAAKKKVNAFATEIKATLAAAQAANARMTGPDV